MAQHHVMTTRFSILFLRVIGWDLDLTDFQKAVESYCKSLAISWYKHQTVKSELIKCKNIGRIEYLKEEDKQN